MDEKGLNEAFSLACAKLAKIVGCPLLPADWGPEDCLGPSVCDRLKDVEVQEARCWKALCAGQRRVMEEVGSGG